ncbi:sugar ABC transporter permease [Paenibacillus sp. BC26]|uniref:ABC transporter permease n=1 Tax=Paenibacillus sp. BC26 TaxID=1881032 RepID=UPI0008E6AB0B|nr:ABC transporter permease subunit [Paenibacillus sp. BC26]SFT15898.1 putative aldouronate transport system permease protein [Paenibacillus sp. BC26]
MNRLSVIKRKGLLPLYAFIVPGIVLIVLFNYIPMLGLQIAFRDYNFQDGIWGSTWVGLQNFKEFSASTDFWRATGNTFLLTILRLLFIFPTTIVFALLINEVRSFRFKRFVQSLSYLPHFISWIVVVGFLDAFLSIDGGGANSLLRSLGIDPIAFMGSETWFRPIFVLSSMWKEVGWGTILYLAAISSINPVYYEAAVMDGAGRFSQMRYITLPSLVPIISIVLILTVPSLLSVGIDQIYAMINPANIGVAEVIDTYVLRLGIGQAQYSQTTAIGLVMSVISTILLLISNMISKRIGGDGIW